MMRQMLRRIPAALLLAALAAAQQAPAPKAPPVKAYQDDISGMYTFLQEGEFVQINVESPGRQFVKVPMPRDPSSMKVENVPDGGQTNVNTVYTPPAPEKLPVGNKPLVVTGFVSRFGDTESDKGAFLDQFITKGTLYGNEISFTTKPLHGVWFEFKGKLERGTAKTRAEEGYYVIRGTLKRFTTDANKKTTSQSREATFKSFADIDTENPGD